MRDTNFQVWNDRLIDFGTTSVSSALMQIIANLNNRCERTSTILSELKKCIISRDLHMGMLIHEAVVNSGTISNIYVASTILNMYAKCGRIKDARCIFDKMEHRDVVAWNSIIFAYMEDGQGKAALDLFVQMGTQGFIPNSRTFIGALKACVVTKAEKLVNMMNGMSIHTLAALSSFHSDLYIANTLIDMYSKLGCMRDGQEVFDRMEDRNVVSWTTLILGYVDNGEGEVALFMFTSMVKHGCLPNALTFVAAIKACVQLADVEDSVLSQLKGLEIHAQAVHIGCHSDNRVANTLVDMYVKLGYLTDAHRTFDRIRHPDVVSWNALMFGYVGNGEGIIALGLLERMKLGGCPPDALTFVAALKACNHIVSGSYNQEKLGLVREIHYHAVKWRCTGDIRVRNKLIDAYAKCGSMLEARDIFEGMRQHDEVSWTALILGYADNGEPEIAIELFLRMETEGCAPGIPTYVVVLKACTMVGALHVGKALHASIVARGFHTDVILMTTLIDFYAKCGAMAEAQKLFELLSKKDFVAWTALMSGYSHQGNTKRVLELFRKMLDNNMQVNRVTLLCVLVACNHAGLVDKAMEHFQSMPLTYGVVPDAEHYACMVDILARSNRLDDAVRLMKSMPSTPNVAAWTTILRACGCNMELGKLAFKSLLNVNISNNSGAYVLLSNMYGNVSNQQTSL